MEPERPKVDPAVLDFVKGHVSIRPTFGHSQRRRLSA
jgi:hypothetical protein